MRRLRLSDLVLTFSTLLLLGLPAGAQTPESGASENPGKTSAASEPSADEKKIDMEEEEALPAPQLPSESETPKPESGHTAKEIQQERGTRKPQPRERYNHDFHQGPLTEKGLDCKHCHPFKLDWNDRTTAVIPEFKELFIKPIHEICHDCHRTEARVKKSIFVCTLCHPDTRDVIPKDHRAGWRKKHAFKATTAHECKDCHDQAYCIDCHRRFETIKPRVHSRNYRFFHSIEARVNPGNCYSCHRQSTCYQCHNTGSAFR